MRVWLQVCRREAICHPCCTCSNGDGVFRICNLSMYSDFLDVLECCTVHPRCDDPSFSCIQSQSMHTGCLYNGCPASMTIRRGNQVVAAVPPAGGALRPLPSGWAAQLPPFWRYRLCQGAVVRRAAVGISRYPYSPAILPSRPLEPALSVVIAGPSCAVMCCR